MKTAESIDVQKRWVNPYKLRLKEFPEHLFRFDCPESDIRRIAELCAKSDGLVVELGSGSGAHLIELARRNREQAVLGFEIRYKRAVRTIEKAQKDKLTNCFVARTSYDELIEYLPAHAVEALYINFPDPWAKKRQRKHRILDDSLLDMLPRLLRADAAVSVKTDHQEYYDSFLETLSEDFRYHILEESRDLHRSEYLESSIPTEFEHLFCGQGLPIYYLKFALSSKEHESTDKGKPR